MQTAILELRNTEWLPPASRTPSQPVHLSCGTGSVPAYREPAAVEAAGPRGLPGCHLRECGALSRRAREDGGRPEPSGGRPAALSPRRVSPVESAASRRPGGQFRVRTLASSQSASTAPVPRDSNSDRPTAPLVLVLEKHIPTRHSSSRSPRPRD